MYFCKCYRQPFVIERWKNANIAAAAHLLQGEVQSTTTWLKKMYDRPRTGALESLFPGCAGVLSTASGRTSMARRGTAHLKSQRIQ
jgi:hypothetical protein